MSGRTMMALMMVVIVALLVVAYFWLPEGQSTLPFAAPLLLLLLLVCPIAMFFMGRGNHDRDKKNGHGASSENKKGG